MFSLSDCSRYWIENLISSHITAPSFEILVDRFQFLGTLETTRSQLWTLLHLAYQDNHIPPT